MYNLENLESEIDVFKQEVGELKKAIYQLERGEFRTNFLSVCMYVCMIFSVFEKVLIRICFVKNIYMSFQ